MSAALAIAEKARGFSPPETRQHRVAQINSEPVGIHPLLGPDGVQVMELNERGEQWGAAFYVLDPTVKGGRRVVLWRVERDPINPSQAWVDPQGDGSATPRTYWVDVYARPPAPGTPWTTGHLFPFRREKDAENQTVANTVSKGGNSRQRDIYALKGMTFCTPEQYIEAVLVRPVVNAARDAENRKARDPRKQQENLVLMMRDALQPLVGSRDAGFKAAEKQDEADRLAAENEALRIENQRLREASAPVPAPNVEKTEPKKGK